MYRNFVAYTMLLLLFTYMLEKYVGIPYIASFIVIAPMAITISMITIPPIYSLLNAKIIDENYEEANVTITVAIVETILIIILIYVTDHFAIEQILMDNAIYVAVAFLVLNVLAYMRDYYKRWVYVLTGLNFLVLFYIWQNIGVTDPFYIRIALIYILVHTIFTISYGTLRHLLRYNFPYVSKWTV